MGYREILPIIAMFLLLTETNSHPLAFTQTSPHQRDCYTQGLFFYNDTHIFQTCGLYNKSYFKLLQYKSQPFELKTVYTSSKPWKVNVFMEGAILFKDFIYVLTWKQYIVYKLHPKTFEIIQEIKWRKQGWGLTHNGTHMFTTDGSHLIYLVDEDFKVVQMKSIETQMGRKLYNINQLEYVDGYIYANVYLDTKIVKIDYQKGKVVEEYDSTSLIKAEEGSSLRHDEVINGIAYEKKTKKFILTGKHWSRYYLVEI